MLKLVMNKENKNKNTEGGEMKINTSKNDWIYVSPETEKEAEICSRHLTWMGKETDRMPLDEIDVYSDMGLESIKKAFFSAMAEA